MEKVLYLMCVVNLTAGFLLNNKACPVTAPAQCTCDYRSVSCQAKALIDVPQFHAVTNSVTTNSMVIDISENQLTRINQAAFQAFAGINNTVYLDLQKNHIVAIDKKAFTGINDKLDVLDLSYNRLTSLPMALLEVDSLEILFIRDNPITHLDASMMYAFSPNFGQIELSMDAFKSWPTEIGMIDDLGGLQIHGGQFSALPPHPFGNLVHTLYFLTVENSKLERIPSDICYFHKLWKITITNSTRLVQSSNICNTPNLVVRDVKLMHNNLNRFPNLLTTFPSTDHLSLDHNNIQYIDSDAIPSNNSLLLLYLSHNKFRQIPFAINKMTKLKLIDLSFNEITTLEENDIQGAKELVSIYLSNNPLIYISRKSLVNNRKLYALHLENTNLVSVPEASMHISSRHMIQLDGSKIMCDCHMSPRIQNTTVDIRGKCYNQANTTIKNYIIQSLPNCPTDK